MPVPCEMIKAVKEYIEIPLIVGGGIRTPDIAHKKAQAGADFVVIGTALETHILKNKHLSNIIKEFAEAIHIND